MERVACSVSETQRKAAVGGGLTALGIRLLAAILVVLGGHGLGYAQPRPSWLVVEISGNADILVSGAQPAALSRSVALVGGEQVRTGADGRVVLRRGEDTLIVAPNSAVVLPAAADGTVTRVLQLLGSLIVRVEQRRDGAFEIRTPFLVAVVKGTLFSVSIDASGGRVHVAEGRVEVTDVTTGATLSLGPGQRVALVVGQAFVVEPSASSTPSAPSLERVIRDVSTGSAGLLSVDGSAAASADVMSGGGAESLLSPLAPPAATVLHGLGGNRTRNGAPLASSGAASSSSGGGGQGHR